MTVLPHTHRPTWSRIPAFRFALPRGPLDLVRQVLIVSIFDIVYELSRVVAVGDRSDALRHARSVVHTEQSLGIFHELSVQRFVAHAPGVVSHAANWTYFNAQFTITFSFLLWAYLFRNDRFTTVRNAIIAADAIGVVGYILYPTAPPRMLTDMGFTDTLNQTAVNNHSSVISALSNPYAAMPSLHTAYALILGASGVVLARHRWTKAIWALYPSLVVFSIVATANHFFLDAVAGAAVATAAGSIVLLVLPRMRPALSWAGGRFRLASPTLPARLRGW